MNWTAPDQYDRRYSRPRDAVMETKSIFDNNPLAELSVEDSPVDPNTLLAEYWLSPRRRLAGQGARQS